MSSRIFASSLRATPFKTLYFKPSPSSSDFKAFMKRDIDRTTNGATLRKIVVDEMKASLQAVTVSLVIGSSKSELRDSDTLEKIGFEVDFYVEFSIICRVNFKLRGNDQSVNMDCNSRLDNLNYAISKSFSSMIPKEIKKILFLKDGVEYSLKNKLSELCGSKMCATISGLEVKLVQTLKFYFRTQENGMYNFDYTGECDETFSFSRSQIAKMHNLNTEDIAFFEDRDLKKPFNEERTFCKFLQDGGSEWTNINIKSIKDVFIYTLKSDLSKIYNVVVPKAGTYADLLTAIKAQVNLVNQVRMEIKGKVVESDNPIEMQTLLPQNSFSTVNLGIRCTMKILNNVGLSEETIDVNCRGNIKDPIYNLNRYVGYNGEYTLADSQTGRILDKYARVIEEKGSYISKPSDSHIVRLYSTVRIRLFRPSFNEILEFDESVTFGDVRRYYEQKLMISEQERNEREIYIKDNFKNAMVRTFLYQDSKTLVSVFPIPNDATYEINISGTMFDIVAKDMRNNVTYKLRVDDVTCVSTIEEDIQRLIWKADDSTKRRISFYAGLREMLNLDSLRLYSLSQGSEVTFIPWITINYKLIINGNILEQKDNWSINPSDRPAFFIAKYHKDQVFSEDDRYAIKFDSMYISSMHDTFMNLGMKDGTEFIIEVQKKSY